MMLLRKKRYVIIFLIISFSFARAKYSIHIGINASDIEPGPSKVGYGHHIGIKKMWGSQKKNISISLEHYEKKSYLPYRSKVYGMASENGVYSDYSVILVYLEFPVLFSKSFRISSNTLLGFSVGPSVAFSIYDRSKRLRSRDFFTHSENPEMFIHGNYDYIDDEYCVFCTLNNSSICFNFGILLQISKSYFEFRYSHSTGDLHVFANSIVNNEQFKTLKLLVGYNL